MLLMVRNASGVGNMVLFTWLFKKKRARELETRQIHKENIKMINKASATLKQVEETRSPVHESIAERIYGAMGGGTKR